MDPNFTVSSDFLRANNVTLDGNTASTTLKIEADCNWAVTEDVEWLAASPVQGSGSADVTLTAGVNPSSVEERSCQLTVTSDDGVRRVITLHQSRATEALSVSTGEIAVNEDGDSRSFTITSNTNWTVTGGAEWLSYTPDSGSGDGSVAVAVKPNTSEYSRDAVLTITGAGGATQKVAVSQSGKDVILTIEPEVIAATAVADDYTFKVEGNASWKVTADVTWVTSYTPAEGTDEATVTVSLPDNTDGSPRTANIRVTSASGKIQRTCAITQAAATVPAVETVAVSGLGRYIATFTSAFSSPLEVTGYGFVWSDSPSPTIENCKGHVSNADGEALSFTPTDYSGRNSVLTAGGLTTSVNTLKSGVKYYVRAYAVNEFGTGYSTDFPFETSGNIPGEDENPVPNI